MKLLAFVGILGLLSPTALSAQSNTSKWSVNDQVFLKGNSFWDYVAFQPKPRRLYLAHQTEMTVLDLSTLAVVEIPGKDIHGIALAPRFNRGFITDGGNGQVIVIDLKTLQVEKSLLAQPDVDSICYDQATRRVFAFSGDGKCAVVIDALKSDVLTILPLEGKPESSQADGKGSLYLNLEDKDQVVKIDAAKIQVSTHWDLPSGSAPTGMDLDRERNRLFIGCRNGTLLVLNSLSGEIVATLPIGKWVDGIVYDPIGRRVFASCADGTLSVIHQDTTDAYSVTDVIQTEVGSHTMAFDPATGSIYVPTAKLKPISPTDAHPVPHLLPETFRIVVWTAMARKIEASIDWPFAVFSKVR